jgi:hypothetical protein
LEGDFVLAQFDVNGKKEIFYTEEGMCSKDDDNDYEANFLRRNKMGDEFIKPETEDGTSDHEKHIK